MRQVLMVLALTFWGCTVARAEPSGGDRHFVAEAAAGGLGEVKLATLAMERGQAIEVKQFARKMLEDHSKANTELQSLAEKKNLTVPTALDAKRQLAYDKLAKLGGAAFDREYMKAMTEEHDAAVKLFTDEMQKGQDEELRSFASKALPVLEKHDEMAHQNAR
jgi:putative membrane protein